MCLELHHNKTYISTYAITTTYGYELLAEYNYPIIHEDIQIMDMKP